MEPKIAYATPPEPDYQDAREFRVSGRDEEAALIGSCLRRPQLFDELREIVKPESFGWAAYGHAWRAMLALCIEGQAIDTLTVGDELERKGNLDTFLAHDTAQWTGRAALSHIRDQGQPQNARTYAETVQDYSAKRELMGIANTLAMWSANGRRAHDILNDTEKKLAAVQVGSGKAARHAGTIKDAINRAYERTDKASRGEITYLPTGFTALDDIVTGFTSPDLWVVAARMKMGKTAFMSSVVWNIIWDKEHKCPTGKKVAFFTLEMGMEQIAMRFISMISGVSYKSQLTGVMSDSDWPLYNWAVETLSNGELGLYLNDMPSISPNKIRQEIRRSGPFDLIVVDYIQIAGADEKYDIRNQEVAAITKALKNICKEFDVPMMAAAQLNRAAEARAASDKRPILSDLGESDELGKTADKVLFIHGESGSNEREIIVAANRNGPPGMCKLAFIGYKTLFQNQVGFD
jgi:replicative DNA helicase